MEETGKMKIPFGKYKDLDIVYADSHYLRYLDNQDWFWEKFEPLALAVQEEMKIRDLNNSHFDEDSAPIKPKGYHN